jgi:hypothetical protein
VDEQQIEMLIKELPPAFYGRMSRYFEKGLVYSASWRLVVVYLESLPVGDIYTSAHR